MGHFDVVIVGAGLSGIGAAYHLQKHCPDKTYAIVESRDALGGTWDLFRYPGIRSDSDMHTLGYGFKPWRAAQAIADGPAILDYINETADTVFGGGMGVVAGVFMQKGSGMWPLADKTLELYTLDRSHYLREVFGTMGEIMAGDAASAASHEH